MSDDLILSTEAAAILGLTQRTFNRRVISGAIPVAQVIDGDRITRLFSRTQLEKLAAA